MLVIVRLDHVSVRELNSGAISKPCPGDDGQGEIKIPCGAGGACLHAHRRGSRCLILRQNEYNISHRNVLPFLSSSLLSLLCSAQPQSLVNYTGLPASVCVSKRDSPSLFD